MKSFKKALIIISTILLVTLIIGAIVLANNQEKEVYENLSNKDIELSNEIETEEKNEEIIPNMEKILEVIDEQKEEKETIEQDIPETTKIENNNTSVTKSTNSSITNKTTTNKVEALESTQSSTQSTINNNNQPKTTATTVEQPKIENTPVVNKSEETKQQETTPVNPTPTNPTPVDITPVRTYKRNGTYIEKLKNAITTTVTNNLASLNKYGITSVEQFIITEDSSICVCYGGNRGGWTFENTTAYSTFINSILKGTSMKIYAVDEYQDGEYIQTLCYYGH